ncbi:hypothetical protein VP1G_03935 [Cytospora mali]|uniref:Uncharacterized protein n=1 Tax=Cytospora mali TaxID=578113 RepID=A0A194UY54_CYTMA|nr:hypothetical protein VP1G_03935 [Valsa mali var. pyri (nom. inval.)]
MPYNSSRTRPACSRVTSYSSETGTNTSASTSPSPSPSPSPPPTCSSTLSTILPTFSTIESGSASLAPFPPVAPPPPTSTWAVHEPPEDQPPQRADEQVEGGLQVPGVALGALHQHAQQVPRAPQHVVHARVARPQLPHLLRRLGQRLVHGDRPAQFRRDGLVGPPERERQVARGGYYWVVVRDLLGQELQVVLLLAQGLADLCAQLRRDVLVVFIVTITTTVAVSLGQRDGPRLELEAREPVDEFLDLGCRLLEGG